jgi:hypothetical protein
MCEKLNVKEWLAIRKEEGLKIDPETAEVTWDYADARSVWRLFGKNHVMRRINAMEAARGRLQ